MTDYDFHNAAAANLLARSLRLREHNNLLIVADQDSLDVAETIMHKAREMEIHATCVFAPRSQQAAYKSDDELPATLLDAIHTADGVLSCLADAPAFLAFRTAVLQASTTRFARTLHAPGLTFSTFKAVAVDYDLVRQSCCDLALPLVMGRNLEIFSSDHLGNEYRFSVALPGWDSPPVISDGVVAKGRWANLPPGETFILPTGGDGTIAINGSLPGMVLAGADSVVLRFERGRLVEWAPKNGTATCHLFATQLDAARSAGDPNWSNLAEIGFGVNPLIGNLLGVEVFDEKKAGTLHVALGGNIHLGGQIDATIHCDLIVERPTVHVDSHPILVQGELRLQPSEWLLDVYRVRQGHGFGRLLDWWQKVTSVHRSVARAEVNDGRLYRAWVTKSGRYGRLPVGADRSARLAAHLYEVLPENAAIVSRDELIERAAQVGVPASLTPACVWLLLQYDLVHVKEA